MKRLSWVLPLSIFVTFLLLFDAYKSFRSALLIVANIPLWQLSGIVALSLTGIPLSVSAAIGFIAHLGQAVLNGVDIVTHCNELRSEGRGLVDAVRQGSQTRLRAVLMTALLAMLGLLPMALSHAIGGLASATVLTLLVLPTVYIGFARHEGVES